MHTIATESPRRLRANSVLLPQLPNWPLQPLRGLPAPSSSSIPCREQCFWRIFLRQSCGRPSAKLDRHKGSSFPAVFSSSSLWYTLRAISGPHFYGGHSARVRRSSVQANAVEQVADQRYQPTNFGMEVCKRLLLLYICIAFTCGKLSTNAFVFPPLLDTVEVNGNKGSLFFLHQTRNLTLTCSTTSAESDFNISWRIDSTGSAAGARRQLPPDWRGLRAAGRTEVHLSSEAIKQDPAKYEGWYECVVNSSAGSVISSPIRIVFPQVISSDIEDVEMSATTVVASAGSTVILPCNSSAPITYTPSLNDVLPTFAWLNTDDAHVPSRLDNRIVVDEKGTMYIRDARVNDSRGAPRFYECLIRGGLTKGITRLGVYRLQISEKESRPTGPKLVHSTPDIITHEGSTVRMSCIFEDKTELTQDVVWNGPGAADFARGSLLSLQSVNSSYNGTWQCRYKDLSANLSLTVLDYPVLYHSGDAYVDFGDEARFECTLSSHGEISFWWLFNGRKINPSDRVLITSGSNRSSLTIRNVGKVDQGVIQCVVKNRLATAEKSMRLVCIEKPEVALLIVPERPEMEVDKSIVYVTENTTTVRLLCNYSVSEQMSSTGAVWRLQRFEGDITSRTVLPAFGIAYSVYDDVERHLSFITIHITPDTIANVAGDVQCVMTYRVLHKEFRHSSRETVQIVQHTIFRMVPPKPEAFPYWIIAVILAVVLAMALAVMIIRHMHQHKEVGYNIGRLELATGRDPLKQLPNWMEYSRPETDPIRGNLE